MFLFHSKYNRFSFRTKYKKGGVNLFHLLYLSFLFCLLFICTWSVCSPSSCSSQIAHARFGKATHILFCIMALISALIYITSVVLAGKSSLEVLGKDMNNEFIFLTVAVLSGSYCMVGGLGTTFYISYFNTALTFITVSVYILYTSVYPDESIQKYSSIASMYEAAVCLEAPEGNANRSYLTFRSESGLIYGVVLVFMATSSGFADQANWQSRIAAKPFQGTFGFLVAAIMWFVIPSTLSFTACMTYFAMSAENGTHLLTELEIDEGESLHQFQFTQDAVTLYSYSILKHVFFYMKGQLYLYNVYITKFTKC